MAPEQEAGESIPVGGTKTKTFKNSLSTGAKPPQRSIAFPKSRRGVWSE